MINDQDVPFGFNTDYIAAFAKRDDYLFLIPFSLLTAGIQADGTSFCVKF